jgi:DNA-binding NarL/FixJ family response regulator
VDNGVDVTAARPRIALVEDIAALRAALPAVLPELDFAGTYPNIAQLLAERPESDLVLLDLHLSNRAQPEADQGPAAVQQVVQAGYRVCLYTQEERRFVIAACLAAGAEGLIAKSEPVAAVGRAVLRVLGGEVLVPQSIIGLAEVLVTRGSLTILSNRQRQLLAGRARGQTYAEIGTALYLSESTLRGYWQDLLRVVAQHLQESAPADIERVLGLTPGDLLDLWPHPNRRARRST